MDYRILNIHIALFLVFCLVIMVLLKGEKGLPKHVYTTHVVSLCLWILGLLLFYQTNNQNTALFWTRFLYVTASIIPATFLHFSYVFTPGSSLAVAKQIVLYLPNAILFYLFFFTPHIVKDVFIENGERGFIYGWGHFLWDLQFGTTFCLGLNRFYKIYKTNVGIQQLRAKYILLGTLFPLILATTTNVIMPWFNRFDLLWVGPFAALGWVSLSAYTIIRYRVLNTSIVLQRGLLFLFLFLVLSVPFTLLNYFTESLTQNTIIRSTLMLAFVLTAGLILLRVRVRSEVTLDQFLSKAKYQYRNTLNKLSKELVSKLDLKELLNETVNMLSQAIVVKKVEIYVYNKDQLELKATTEGAVISKILSFKPVSPLHPEGKILFREEQKEYPKEIKNLFEKLKADVLIPIEYKSAFLALCILGESEIDYIYSEEDVQVFKVLSNQIAIALQNAKSYQLIQDLNKNLEQKVKERSDQLIEAQKLASIGRLVAGIAHHINNKINPPIQGAAILKKALGKIKTGKSSATEVLPDMEVAVEAIEEELKTVKTIVEDLLVSSHQSQREGRFAPVDVNSILRAAVRVIRTDCVDRIALHEDYLEPMPKISGDVLRLEEVFLNMLKNAFDAIPQKGDMWVRTGVEDSQVVVSIRDNGVGIPEENLDKIFDFFFTTKDVGRGTGLGLSVSYATIKDHRGEIKVKSKPGEGTEFRIKLPFSVK